MDNPKTLPQALF